MQQGKKTKIVATIGPATTSEAVLTKLVKSGLNVMRLNFSHGDFAEHQEKVDNLRKVTEKLGTPVAVLQDLSGPKIRIGDFYKERVILKEGDEFVLTTEKCVGDEHRAYINYPKLPAEIEVGRFIMVDDGKKKLQVLSVKGNEIRTKIIVGGETKGRRGVNLPGTDLSISSLTAKDKKDIEFGVKNRVDFMALSFVRRASDVHELRRILEKKGLPAQIVVKLETTQAMDNLEEIIRATDAVMVARGDLAVEVPAEQVPLLQKRIVQMSRELGKPVIVATQMLESMINSPVPTRAEVSDVANAILDGADAVMLSEETTLGKYPVEAVSMMSKVAMEVEAAPYTRPVINGDELDLDSVAESVSEAVEFVAYSVDAKAIVALSQSGFTMRAISRYRPDQPIVVLTPDERTVRRACLSYGCYGYHVDSFKEISEAVAEASAILKKEKYAKKGDRFVVSGGAPLGKGGETNFVMVRTA
ncbi:MAG: pyruvate kinase [Candidatus Moranbacteria bacterium]|nr:pyruvate kinase [Candidatus Moranbacteria bacterium]